MGIELAFRIVTTNTPLVTISESTVYMKVSKALTDGNLIKGIKKASPSEQTSCLEGFHSVLNQFAPKMISYSYPGMLCRSVLPMSDNVCNIQVLNLFLSSGT